MNETWDPRECLDRAQAPQTDAAELARLSRSTHIFVREAVAEHPNTPAAILELLAPGALAHEDDFRMAIALLKNAKLPSPLLKRIAAYAPSALPQIVPHAFYPRGYLEALVANPEASVDILGSLLSPLHSPRHIREWIARKTSRTDVLEFLSHDPSETVASRANRRLNEHH